MKRRAFTLIEVLVVVAIIALLIAILIPSLHRARELSKRTICMHGLQQLGAGWQIYHTENKGAFIGGAAFDAENTDPNFLKTYPPGWVRFIGTTPASQPEERQIWAIRSGALYKYTRYLELYHCPAIKKGEIRTYSANWGADGYPGNWNNRGAWRIDQLKRPSDRMVFIDDYPENWDAIWTVTPWAFQFWNPLAIRHDKGTTLSFGDGHAEIWRWTDPDTLKFVAMSWDAAENWNAPVMPNNRDIKRLQMASWGKLDNSGVQ